MDCVIGIHDFERGSRQRLLLSIVLEMDFRVAAASDDIDDALDYVGVARRAAKVAQDGRFHLLEALAEAIVVELLTPPVRRVRLDVSKPAALPDVRRLAVRIERSR